MLCFVRYVCMLCFVCMLWALCMLCMYVVFAVFVCHAMNVCMYVNNVRSDCGLCMYVCCVRKYVCMVCMYVRALGSMQVVYVRFAMYDMTVCRVSYRCMLRICLCMYE